MARGPLLFARVVRPVRSLWQRFAFATLIGMALSLMIADEVDIKVFKQIKTNVIHSVGTLLELGPRLALQRGKVLRHLQNLENLKMN